MLTKRLAQQLLFTSYLSQRDCLSAAMTRLGNGFTPPSAVYEAKHHLANINHLMNQMEDLSRKPSDAVIQMEPRQFMEKSCCGRD